MAPLDDPDVLWQAFHLPDAPRNYSDLSSQEIVDALNEQSIEFDAERCEELMDEFAARGASRSVLYSTLGNSIQWKYVKGYSPNHIAPYSIQHMEHVWLDR